MLKKREKQQNSLEMNEPEVSLFKKQTIKDLHTVLSGI